MTAETAAVPAPRAPADGPPKLDLSTRLAIDRTVAAHERTMLAWVRTATSLISFGFTIYKFFQFERHGQEAEHHLIGPTQFSVLMVLTVLAALWLSAVEYRASLDRLREVDPAVPRSRLGGLAALIGLLGAVALLAMIFRL